MTQEEKAKRYDEVFNAAKEWYNNPNSSNIGKSYLYAVFPELKENEDEKIRKVLIDYFKRYKEQEECGIKTFYGIPADDILAWLEKQGEQKPQGKSALEAINEEKVDNSNRVEPKDYNSIDPHFCKPADKVEPKFHEGEWLCENEPNNYARFIQILEIVDVQGKERYRISRDIHNDEDIVEFDFVEKYYHKFDIEDAMVGDVLATKDAVFIVKYIDHTLGLCKSYCEVICNLELGLGFNFAINSARPATKEQRDKLEKEMADAGYTFDFEKKELKKIVAPKFNIGDTMRTLQEATDNITSGLPVVVSIDEEYYHCNNELIAIKDQDNYEYPPMNRRQKPAWSEEDEEILNLIIARLQSHPDVDLEEYSKEYGWLNSPKARYTWKPSDEQMNTLEHYMTTLVCNEHKEILFGLYEDLKKLK